MLLLLKKEKIHLLIFRAPDKQVRVRRLLPAQADLLTRFARKEPIGKALQKTAARHRLGKLAASLETWFQKWVEEGIIKRIKFSGR